jgi:hypothetical protein
MRVDLDTGKYNVVISSSNFDVSIESGAKLDVNIGKSARIDVNSAVTYIKSGKKEIDTYVEGKVKPDILEYSKVESQKFIDSYVGSTVEEYVEEVTKPSIDEYTDTKINQYNQNAVSKTDDFNTLAQSSEETLIQYVDSASLSAKNAKDSADVSTAQASISTAQAVISTTKASESLASANASANSAINSENSAKASAKSLSDAKGVLSSTIAQKDIAVSSASSAKESETKAKASETNAKTSENNAKASELSAKTSETNAKTSETNASQSATKSAQSEANALSYSQSAKSSSDSASNSVVECQAIKDSLGTVYTFKGSVQSVSSLPSGASIGDVYDVIDSGNNYAWTGSSWDSLGVNVDLSNYALKSDLNTKQDKLTAGTGISISNNVISNTQTSAEWGNIKGTLSNQTDLQNAFNNKVSRTGDEAIAGAKTFLGTTIRNKCSIADSTASTISSTEEKGLLILDSKSNRIGNFYGGQLADGSLRTYMCACRPVNGSMVYQYAQIKQASDGTGVFSINCNSALAPTPPTGDNSTRIATTQWVRNVVADDVTYEDLDEEVTINPTPIREEWQTFQNTINNLISSLEVELNKVKSVRYVVEKGQDGNRWYTLYSDGWCEQGGVTSAWFRGTTNVIYFLKTFKSKPTFICNLEVTNGEANEMRVAIGNTSNNSGVNFVTTSQATVYIHGISGSGTDGGLVHWVAKGYIS